MLTKPGPDQLSSLRFLNKSTEKTSLRAFTALLDARLNEQNLEIINGPNLNSNNALRAAQEELRIQETELQKYGSLCGSIKGLMLLLLGSNPTDPIRVLGKEERINYYNQQAKITMSRKKCTCQGLAAAALVIGFEIINKNSLNQITIDLCHLRNWGHTLLRLSTTEATGDEQSFFYDPWYQRCYTTTRHEPKIIPIHQLGIEMKNLITQTEMIKPTEQLSDLDNQILVNNLDRDFAYFVACSNHHFESPSPTIPDPTIYPRYYCNLI